jgi:hypothetical protein
MKHYTLRALIHDAKVFSQLWLEHRRDRKNRRKDSRSHLPSRSFAGPMRRARA